MRKALTQLVSLGLLTVMTATCRSGPADQPEWAVDARAFGDFLYKTNGLGVCITHYGGSNSVVRIPSVIGGRSVVKIGDVAFASCQNEACTGLTRVTIPATVTNIESYAFYWCALTNVFFEGKPPEVGDDVFSGQTPTIYYLPTSTGWPTNFAGCPTRVWKQKPNDKAQPAAGPNAQ